MGYDKVKVKESIEPENVYDILEYFGAEPEMYSDYIISRTICHNGIGEGSKKLYYYLRTVCSIAILSAAHLIFLSQLKR